MNHIALPIMVFEGLDLGIFHSIYSAENSLEPWWVHEGLGDAYDSEGYKLRLTVRNNEVVISKDTLSKASCIELKQKLISFINYCQKGEIKLTTHDNLPFLISASEKFLDGVEK